MEPLKLQDQGILDCLQLCRDDRQYRDINTVELIKATPGSTLTQTRVDLTYSLEQKEQ